MCKNNTHKGNNEDKKEDKKEPIKELSFEPDYRGNDLYQYSELLGNTPRRYDNFAYI